MTDRFVSLPGTPTYSSLDEAFDASEIGDRVLVGPGYTGSRQHVMAKAVDVIGVYVDGYPVRPFADPTLLPSVDDYTNFIQGTYSNTLYGSPLHMWNLPSIYYNDPNDPALLLNLSNDAAWGDKDTVLIQDLVMFGGIYGSSSSYGDVMQLTAFPTTTKTVRFSNCVFCGVGYNYLNVLFLDINDNVVIVFDQCLFLASARYSGPNYWFGSALSETKQRNIYFNRCEVRRRTSTIPTIASMLPYQEPENLDFVYAPTADYGWEYGPFYEMDLYSIFGTITDIPDFVTGDDFRVYLFEERGSLGSNEIKFPEIGSKTLDVDGNWSFQYLPRDKRYGVLIQPPDGMQGHWLRWYNPALQ